jgi:type I restriction enzyme S subunit
MLDDMAGLIDALEEELAARKKQYEWYRDRLMIFGDDVERKPLGSFAEITRGGSLQKRDFTEAGIPCIHYGQIYTRFGVWTDKPLTYTSSEKVPGQKFANVGDIVMAVTSETVEDVCKCVAWIGDVPAVVSGHTAVIHHNQNPKYLSYYFHTSQFAIQKWHLAHGVKVIEVTPERLKDVIIPIPKLNDQNKIVRELDDMTALIDTIYEEIALRKQQYEYYRDKLLAFKGKPEVA